MSGWAVTECAEGETSERLLQPTTTRLFLIVMGSCLIYAGIRYHVVQGVSLAHAPLYILNKAISLGGYFRKNPPSADWDGVWKMSTK